MIYESQSNDWLFLVKIIADIAIGGNKESEYF